MDLNPVGIHGRRRNTKLVAICDLKRSARKMGELGKVGRSRRGRVAGRKHLGGLRILKMDWNAILFERYGI
jgi:hypothetical protein